MKMTGHSVAAQIGTSRMRWMYQGRLANPFTWLKWVRVSVVKRWDFIEASIVPVPIDPSCRIVLKKGCADSKSTSLLVQDIDIAERKK